jgi:hypothetical protein
MLFEKKTRRGRKQWRKDELGKSHLVLKEDSDPTVQRNLCRSFLYLAKK